MNGMDLLANLIEKYAAVLDIDNLPEPPVYEEVKREVIHDIEKNFTVSCIDDKRIA